MLKEGIRAGLPQSGHLAATAAGLHRRLNRRPDGIMQRVNALRRLDPEFDRFIRQHVRRPADADGDAHLDDDMQPPEVLHDQPPLHAPVPSTNGARRAADVDARRGGRVNGTRGEGRNGGRGDGMREESRNGTRSGRGPRDVRERRGQGPRDARRGGKAARNGADRAERWHHGREGNGDASRPEPARAETAPITVVDTHAAEVEAARRAVGLIVPWLEARVGELPEEARQRLARLVYDEGATRVALAIAESMLAFSELLLDRAEKTLQERNRTGVQEASGQGSA